MIFSPAILDLFRKNTGAEDPAEYFGFEVRRIKPLPAKASGDSSRYIPVVPPGARLDEWGVCWVPGSAYHFERMVHPLARFSTVTDVEGYPFPDLVAPGRFANYREEVQRLQKAGYAVVGDCCPLGGTVLWPAYKLRGMQALLTDMLMNEGFASALLERVTEISAGLAAHLATMDVDIIFIADDFGTQRGLLVSLAMWRRWFKERLARVISAAKAVNPRVLMAFHSDGAIESLIPELVEIGVDVLNPVQPECMEPAQLKARFGDHLAFWGTVGTQTTLPFGTPDDVRAVVRERIRTVGRGGGLLLAPTHMVEPEVPWENILAFIQAIDEFGVYA
jgi:uroporphyrinogen decarboxylase